MMATRQILDVDRLRAKGWSDRSIARHLDLDLRDVRIHLGIATHDEIVPEPPPAEGVRPDLAAAFLQALVDRGIPPEAIAAAARRSPATITERVRARKRRLAGAAE